MKSQRRVFLEIDENLLTLSLAMFRGKAVQIQECRYVELEDLRPDRISKALAPLINDLNLRDLPCHVAFGDRRFVHTRTVLPRLDPPELQALVEREIRREGSLSGDKAVLSDTRLVGRQTDGRHEFTVTAVPKDVWEPIREGLSEAGLDIVQMTSLDDATAAALAKSELDPIAILDLGTSRIRFVHCEGRSVRQVRRIFLPSTNLADAADAAMAASHLALEIPRTLDFLSGLGCKPPEALLVGQRLSLSEDDLMIIRGDIPDCHRLESNVVQEGEGEVTPSLATQGLINTVLEGSTRNLLANRPIIIPRPLFLSVSWAAVVALAFIASMAGIMVNADLAATARDLDRINRASNDLAGRTSDWIEANTPEEPPSDPRLAALLGTRRPVSHLVGEVCRRVPEGVHLTGLRLLSQDRIEITGTASSGSRLESLGLAAGFVQQLVAIPYLSKQGEEIEENRLNPENLRFKVLLHWRTP
ncbi:MAG: hypothetical protein ACYTG5_04985 [Planctomycetota bacterium]|jgi:hypothetical protein